jgi:hypothetical protein
MANFRQQLGSQIKLGYPLQSAFQSSKPTFSIYRAFDYLHSRVILELQDQLRELEAELGKLDKKHSKSKDIKQNARVISRMRDLEVAKLAQDSGTTDDMSEPSVHVGPTEQPSRKVFRSRRAMLLEEIQQKLVRYDETLANARRLNEFQRPSDRDRLNLQRWLGNERPVNFKPEEDFIRFKYDLITLNPRSDSGKIDAWIENAIGKLPIGMTSVSGPWHYYEAHQTNIGVRSTSTSSRSEASRMSIRTFSMLIGLNAWPS